MRSIGIVQNGKDYKFYLPVRNEKMSLFRGGSGYLQNAVIVWKECMKENFVQATNLYLILEINATQLVCENKFSSFVPITYEYQ